ncbi:MAG: DNA mismatch repair protein MutS, partial [Oligoflexia bacterium]|nr:DNA mismatch repair protein MutS [Oligoflexia bacterium]
FGLITGPNMAGKTTVMREVAIIQFLAQLGSFVPASSAQLGLCDRLFGRLGANDDIIRGQSTFMVEMSETAEILRHATEHSLIIIDEVGRGTSTYDGLSIAWALVEYLVSKVRAITLFSTHYQELIKVVGELPAAKNFSVETSVVEGEVRFLYRLLERGTEDSYGIYVAKLAGMPRLLLQRAEYILQQFEEKESNMESQRPQHDYRNIPITEKYKEYEEYEETKEMIEMKEMREMIAEIKKIDIMSITPLQAMEKLYQLKQTILQ